jgi:hypothetical protein
MRLLSLRWSSAIAVAGVMAMVGCHRGPVAAPPSPPPIPEQQIEAPVMAPVTSASPVEADTAHELHVDIDTHNREEDVRLLLDFVANTGHFTLVYPPALNKKVRVRLDNVPVSVALQTLLSLADLELMTTTPGAKTPGIPSVVFYQLPVNVDSLSAEAIMKRFGVGPGIADLIVKSRTNKP